MDFFFYSDEIDETRCLEVSGVSGGDEKAVEHPDTNLRKGFSEADPAAARNLADDTADADVNTSDDDDDDAEVDDDDADTDHNAHRSSSG